MKWKDKTRGGYEVRNVRRTGKLFDYPWEGEERWGDVWEERTWTDQGEWTGSSPTTHDLVPADEPSTKTETLTTTGTVVTFGLDCTICEQSEPVDGDGICEHCRERLNGLGYFKNAQAIGMAEQLGTLKGLIEHLAEKCK